MDNSTRIGLIALLIVVALFVAIVLWGLLKHDTSPSGGNRKQRAGSMTVPPVMQRIDSLFGSLRPSLKLAQQTFSVPARGQLGPIAVPPTQKTSEKFRNGKFRLRANGAQALATLEYQDFAAPLDKTYADLANQSIKFPAPADEPKRRNEDPSGLVGSIVALKSGGTLTFHCNSTAPCTFELVQ